jgi:hypothetical protein
MPACIDVYRPIGVCVTFAGVDELQHQLDCDRIIVTELNLLRLVLLLLNLSAGCRTKAEQ